jgi:hypothetical protein
VTPLTRDEIRILQHAVLIEAKPDDGSRQKHVRDRLDLPYTTFLQRLNRLIDRPEAYAEYPQLVARLRRRRDAANKRRGHAALAQ